ncbi:hypothetical protein LmNIHS28_01406 [Listeria monocytogenes]|nr:hypothetical protein LmNIHS28_01406 [Listeria monocytogenes]
MALGSAVTPSASKSIVKVKVDILPTPTPSK